ncbi:MAG: AraC family transcriptional regulator [Clostridia bacterium]|nr:AraC family transcriptional regulator [Clostridia bacterium]
MAKKLKTITSQNKYRVFYQRRIPENFNFIPIELGHAQCDPGYVWQTPEDRLTIHYIYSGKGVLEKDGKIYHLSRGDAFVLDCNKPVKYTADMHEPWCYYWIHFHSPKFSKKIDKLESPVFKTLNESAFLDATARGDCGILTPEYLISKLYLLYDDIFGKSEIATSDILVEAARIIHENYQSGITVGDLAEHFNVSKGHFSKIFKYRYGISVKQYILKIRFGKAKEYLERGMIVKEAANLCGYTDQLAFSKMYKNIYGVSPKDVFGGSEQSKK